MIDTSVIKMAFDRAVQEQGPSGIQVCLAFVGTLGPAPVQPVPGFAGVYTMSVTAQLGQGPGAKRVRQPITFAIDRLVWFSSGPLDEEDKPLIVPVGGGGPGGLHIPGVRGRS